MSEFLNQHLREDSAANIVIAPGRQYYVGNNNEANATQPYGLSRRSYLNVLGGAFITLLAEAKDDVPSLLVLTGTEQSGYPQGALGLLSERFPDINPIVDDQSPTTLDSARRLAAPLSDLAENRQLNSLYIASDYPQAKRLKRLLEENDGPKNSKIVPAAGFVQLCGSPEDALAVSLFRSKRLTRLLEGLKQNIFDIVDPKATRTEALAKSMRSLTLIAKHKGVA